MQHPTNNFVWHPCDVHATKSPKTPVVNSACGSLLTLDDGTQLLDGISSWWSKSLGHQHPRLKNAVKQQMEAFEHVMLAGLTHDPIAALSRKLCSYTKTLNKVFYAGDGASAVEIALKMSLHAQKNSGFNNKKLFIALRHGYHGETLGALSVTDIASYRDPYQELLFPCEFIENIPIVHSVDDALWHDASKEWHVIEKWLTPFAGKTAAIIVEPIVQGAGGMRMYSQDFLKKLREWAALHHIYFIADEIMTGIGRTGKMFACEHANIEPDFMCLSKGLTSGFLPFSAVLTRHDIHAIFMDHADSAKAFLHSHTFSGHALGARAALEVLDIIEEENLLHRANEIGTKMRQHMQVISSKHPILHHVRGIGALIAADIKTGIHHAKKICNLAQEFGVLLRPLGHTIYWLPPLTISDQEIDLLSEATCRAIQTLER